MSLKKCFLLVTLFLSIFGLNTASYAQGGSDPIPGIDIIIKKNCGPNEDQPCGFPMHLYRCEDGTVVTNSTDCGGQISMVKYMKLDGIKGENLEKIAASVDAMWLCDNGDIVGRPQDCKNDTDDLPALLIEEKKYYELKEQVEKIDGIHAEVAGNDNDEATTKQGENNDPVPGIDVIIKRETVAGPSTLYRCEDGTVVEESADCGSQINMVKYVRAGTGDHGGLDRIQESLTIANSVHICDDGTQVSLPSECDDNSEYDTIIYIPADDFYRIEGHINNTPLQAQDWNSSRSNKTSAARIAGPCEDPENSGPGCDGVDDATTKQGGNDPIEGIDIITKRCTPYPKCDKYIAGGSNLSPEEAKAEKRRVQRMLYKVTEIRVNQYKKKYNTKLQKILPKIPEEKFVEIYERIDAKLEETKNNNAISENKKENLLSFIIAIQEILEDSKTASN